MIIPSYAASIFFIDAIVFTMLAAVVMSSSNIFQRRYIDYSLPNLLEDLLTVVKLVPRCFICKKNYLYWLRALCCNLMFHYQLLEVNCSSRCRWNVFVLVKSLIACCRVCCAAGIASGTCGVPVSYISSDLHQWKFNKSPLTTHHQKICGWMWCHMFCSHFLFWVYVRSHSKKVYHTRMS